MVQHNNIFSEYVPEIKAKKVYNRPDILYQFQLEARAGSIREGTDPLLHCLNSLDNPFEPCGPQTQDNQLTP